MDIINLVPDSTNYVVYGPYLIDHFRDFPFITSIYNRLFYNNLLLIIAREIEKSEYDKPSG